MKRTHFVVLEVSLRAEIVKYVKVKSYKRLRNGKIERIKSYYRRCKSE